VLDIEVSGTLAPGATIAVYFAPNTDRGFIDAILAAIHDKTRRPSVVSISWGSAESSWTEQALKAFDGALQDASLLGVTVCCAAGDGGSGDGAPDGLAHADYPASSAFALACGGTRLVIDQGRSTETVWNDGANGATGGGVSDVFPLPDWQKAAGVPASANPGHRVGRGLPDVAGNADPDTGYEIRADGRETIIGGTSAVAPLVAALIARCNQGLGRRVGFLNPVLYTQAAVRGSFHDITDGSNGAYAAGPGWDACTGWGARAGTCSSRRSGEAQRRLEERERGAARQGPRAVDADDVPWRGGDDAPGSRARHPRAHGECWCCASDGGGGAGVPSDQRRTGMKSTVGSFGLPSTPRTGEPSRPAPQIAT